MDNNTHWRGGRGRGGNRGRGGGSNRGRDQDFFNTNNSSDAPSILSRLGPTNAPINDSRSNNYDRGNNYDRNNNYDRDNGRVFSKNTRRNRNQSGNNARFNNEFMDEDTEMRPDTSTGNIVTVKGYPPGTEEKLLSFLSRKSKVPWAPIHIDYGPNQMHITVIDDTVAGDLCRMNNFLFMNQSLIITRGEDGGGRPSTRPRSGPNNTSDSSTGGSGGRSAYLAEFLRERWNPQAGHLDLDDLPPTSHSISVVLAKLLSEAKFLFGDAVVTLSFARNKLWSVAPLLKVTELFPNLKNLSLQDNEIAEFRSLDKLSNKLNHLQELVLIGNPIQTKNGYRNEVLKRFPSVQRLDFQPTTTTAQAFYTPSDIPVPVRSNFFGQDDSRIAAQDLLSKYFPLFDTNRKALADLYDAQSTFSVIFSKGNFNQESVWGSSQVKPSQRIVIGSENIIKRLCSLPATVHDLSRPDNFVTDAWQTHSTQPGHPVILFLTVHGEFAESPLGTPLSFDRTFLVAPSAPGSRAQAAGWNYVILSDSLIVRKFSCKPASLITA